MTKIAHIIHPVVVPPTSDLTIAQPVTFQSMLTAQAFAREHVEVDLVAVKHHDEDPAVPDGFRWVPDLTRTVMDVGHFQTTRKLALLDDILRGLYAHSDADYLIYTNVDIALQPHFYVLVKAIIDQGYDAFVINRRTIPDQYQHPEHLPFMWAKVGKSHPGHDCFIFRRDAFTHYHLGHICVGTGWIGRVTLWNMLCFATRFHRFKNLHATFHLGDSRTWSDAKNAEYLAFNRDQAQHIHALLQPHAEQLDPNVPHARFVHQLQRPFGTRPRTRRLLRQGRRLAKSVLQSLSSHG